MNLKEIKEMIQLMNENDLAEFELENDGLKVRLKKTPGGIVQEKLIQETRPAQAPAAHISLPLKEEPKAPPVPVPAKITIKSPMVGTFYAAPAPDAAPFVQGGSVVEIGQVVCIIEAMKLMNEIKAEVRGKIAEVLVHNGDPVEFNQPMFTME